MSREHSSLLSNVGLVCSSDQPSSCTRYLNLQHLLWCTTLNHDFDCCHLLQLPLNRADKEPSGLLFKTGNLRGLLYLKRTIQFCRVRIPHCRCSDRLQFKKLVSNHRRPDLRRACLFKQKMGQLTNNLAWVPTTQEQTVSRKRLQLGRWPRVRQRVKILLAFWQRSNRRQGLWSQNEVFWWREGVLRQLWRISCL